MNLNEAMEKERKRVDMARLKTLQYYLDAMGAHKNIVVISNEMV
jgi:hypothetical protein